MEYRPLRVSDLVRDVNRDYFLPDIQREFVWETERIEKLFDSIMQDYPIGSFLFWKVREEDKNEWNSYTFIFDYDEEAPHNKKANLTGINKDVLFVLDGQQRITSLCIGLKGSYRFHHRKWRKTNLYLNLFKEPRVDEDNPEEPVYQFQFRESSKPDSANEHWYPVGRILDFNDAEDAKNDIEKHLSGVTSEARTNSLKMIGKLFDKIHARPILNYYEERTQDPDKVLNIFVRANSGGKALEYSDLLLSVATAKWEGPDARSEINEFVKVLNNIGPGYSFGKDFVLKASLFLTDGLPIQYKVKNFTKENINKIEKNWEGIKESLETTVQLINKFGYSEKNLVSTMALLPIAFSISNYGKKDFHKSSDRQDVSMQRQIQKWLAMSLLKNVFGSKVDTKLTKIRSVMVENPTKNEFAFEKVNSALETSGGLNESEIEKILGFKYGERYTYLALSLLYPGRDWKDIVYHVDHIFPKSEFHRLKLKKRGYDNEKIESYMDKFNCLGNLQLISDTENLSKNATPFDEWIATRDAAFKSTHLIPAISDLSFDNFEQFFAERSKLISTKLGEL